VQKVEDSDFLTTYGSEENVETVEQILARHQANQTQPTPEEKQKIIEYFEQRTVDLPIPTKTGVIPKTKEWLQRQAEKDITIPQPVTKAIDRISRPVQKVHQAVEPYITGEDWPAPPIAQRPPQQRGVRYRYQRPMAYSGRKGYCSVPAGREPCINIFRDSQHMNQKINIFKQPSPQQPMRYPRRRKTFRPHKIGVRGVYK